MSNLAAQCELSSKPLNPFLHSDDSIMFAAIRCCLGLESSAIIANLNCDMFFVEGEVYRHAAGLTVSHGIVERLPCSHQHVVHGGLVEREWFARGSILDGNGEFMAHAFRHFSHQRTDVGGIVSALPQIPYRLPGFVNGCPQLLTSIIQQLAIAVTSLVSHARVRFEQRGNAGTTLNQRVMHLAG